MSICWHLNISDSNTFQSTDQLSFIGGKPFLPEGVDVPKCKLCGSEQAFIFQVSFPEQHSWSGLTLAVFNCVSCVDENYLIPEMLEGPLQGVTIPEGFLDQYQKNFKFIVFKTNEGKLKSDYVEKVSYKPIELELSTRNISGVSKVGGSPDWLLSDESPKVYGEGGDMRFLLQLESDLVFHIIPKAPHQIELGLVGDPEPSPNSYYQLFNSNWIYLFGTDPNDVPLVYAVTQI